MGDDLKKGVADYLASHSYMRLATVTPQGKPLAHTVGYASSGAVVYFVTDRRTRKAQNIAKNPDVAYTVDEEYLDMNRIKGVQMEGRAAILSEESDIKEAAALLEKKFKDMPELPKDFEWVFVKIDPVQCYFHDYSKGFTHADEVRF